MWTLATYTEAWGKRLSALQQCHTEQEQNGGFMWLEVPSVKLPTSAEQTRQCSLLASILSSSSVIKYLMKMGVFFDTTVMLI